MNEGVYYKIYYARHRDCVTVVCMQWFDEYDYHQEHFFKDSDGNVLQFSDENEAKKWLNANVLPDRIDPEFRDEDQGDAGGFNQSKFMK